MAPIFSSALVLFIACTGKLAFAFLPRANVHGQVRSRQVECLTSTITSSFTGITASKAGLYERATISRYGRRTKRSPETKRHGSTMLFGVGETILGVGTPEAVVVLAVGYFVLGPVELFKLARQMGVVVGQLRDVGLGTVNNLSNIMDEQVLRADQRAAGQKADPKIDEDMETPTTLEDEYEDVYIDEYGRVVSDDETRPVSRPAEEEAPFWEGWTGDMLGANSAEGPLAQASKFADQLSGKVNQKVMEVDSGSDPASSEGGIVDLGAKSGMAAASSTAARVPPSSAPGLEQGMTGDIPPELTLEEQFERLDAISALEEERANSMQRLEARIDAKMNSMKSELLQLVEEEYQNKRAQVDQRFASKMRATVPGTSEERDSSESGKSDRPSSSDNHSEGEQGSITQGEPVIQSSQKEVQRSGL